MKTRRKYLVGLLAATLVLTGMPVQHTQAAKAAKLSSKKVTLKVGKSKTITLKNNKKKTTWKVISGKKCIKLKNKKKNKKKNSVKIVAVKSGKAKVQVKAGKKKYTCTVTVKSAKKTNTTKKPTVTKPTSSAKNKNDVSVIKRIIQEQRKKGATVSEDLDDWQYLWENGRLVWIKWNEKNLQGKWNRRHRYGDKSSYRCQRGKQRHQTQIANIYLLFHLFPPKMYL